MVKAKVSNSQEAGSNIRLKASINTPILGSLKIGEEFNLIDEVGGWVKVETKNGIIGFVAVNPTGGSSFTYQRVDSLGESIPVSSNFEPPPELWFSPENRAIVASTLRSLANWVENYPKLNEEQLKHINKNAKYNQEES